MKRTLEKKSNIVFLKSKFFIYRTLSYFSFLLIPVWIQKSIHLHQSFQALIMVFYVIFMAGQWFLLGKEIDYRLKIYFRVNSTMDRILYRLVLGNIAMGILFNIYSFIPQDFLNHFFWGTFVVFGLFYSWPTRGKIIQESVSSELTEFSYLDSFEKTVLALIVVFFIFSFPTIPNLQSAQALKLLFDQHEKISPFYWRFMEVNFFPFQKYSELFKVGWCVHFYFIGLGTFFLVNYCFLRFFVSRRLSILGVFAIISSWSLSKSLEQNIVFSILTTYSMLWIWSTLWVTKSSTYRSGLFLGLVGLYGCTLNVNFIFVFIFQVTVIYFVFLRDHTSWYRRQLLRYCSFGLGLALLHSFFFYENIFDFTTVKSADFYFSHFVQIFGRKSFFVLSVFGAMIILAKFLFAKERLKKSLNFDYIKLNEFLITWFILFFCSVIFEINFISHFLILSTLTFLSVIPLEWIFQSMSRLRSKRNIIYFAYVLVCLLDSHLEGRIKVLLKTFE